MADGVHDLAIDADRSEVRLKHDPARRPVRRKRILMYDANSGDRRVDELHGHRSRKGANRLSQDHPVKTPAFRLKHREAL